MNQRRLLNVILLPPSPTRRGSAPLSSRRDVRFHTRAVSDSPTEDATLVARCRKGDEQAWRDLVERFSRYVFAICVQGFRLPDRDAEDVFQEVFARTYEHLGRLRDDAAIRPWLAQLTRRLCIDCLRGSRRELPADDTEFDIPELDAQLERLDEALDVHHALERLGGDCREILDRFFARDESYKTIGDALELPSGTIASRISRCLAKLRETLEGRKSTLTPSGGSVTR
jgi:RNA polymerase sigma factor (sigma-70 family)